jgi:hypothetical protein
MHVAYADVHGLVSQAFKCPALLPTMSRQKRTHLEAGKGV